MLIKSNMDQSESVATQCASLFEAIEENSNSIDPIVDLLSSTKERSNIIECIKSTKFHKNHARRLFSALGPLLQNSIDQETYVPASAFDEEERRSSNDSANYTNRGSTGGSSNLSKRHSAVSQMIVVPDEDSTKAMNFMKYTAIVAQAYVTNIISRRATNDTSGIRVYDVMKEVWDIIDLLHESLFSLYSCGNEGVSVQRSIVLLCETYWSGHFVQRDEFITQLIPLLVLKTLDGNATKADMKRLWNMRDALGLLNFQDETIAQLRSFLLKTVSSPLYIKNVEGRKMISFLFQLDAGLAKDLHQSIKAQIPMAKRSTLEVYGDIYFRAWKESTQASQELRSHEEESEDDDGDSSQRGRSIQDTIEENVLQDLMFASVHVASPHMATSLRTILEPLYAQKKNPEVEQMLFRMYTPIIWRSLSAANPMVRVHASSILSRTFPLRDPTKGKIHLKEVNDKSVESLLNLMNDVDHKVRVGGCVATIHILGVYWDALSSKDIRALLNQVIMKHASDASSSAVRVQAVNGITQLLDAKASHGVLRPLLPLLGDLIHDRVERVRLATVRLLLKLKKMKGFKYYHTVPSNHLLSRLGAEGEGVKQPTGPVASALTELLSNSYFPQGVKGSEQMRRTLLFLEKNRKAARVFYSNIGYQLEIRSTSKLIVMLMKTLKLAMDRDVATAEASKKKRRRNDSEDEEEQEYSDGVIASNTTLMSGIAQTLLTLLGSIANDLEDPENEGCLQFVQEAMHGAVITDLCMHFESKIENELESEDETSVVNDCHDICASLLGCAGFITSDNRKDLQSQLSDRLKEYRKMSRNDRSKINVVPYLAVFCSWGMQEEVANSLSTSIDSAFTNEDAMESSPQFSPVLATRGKRKQSSNKNVTHAVPRLPGDMGVRIIAQILRGRDPSSLAIRDALVSSENASIVISDALEKATIAAEHMINSSMMTFEDDECTFIELVISAYECFGRLILHKEASKCESLNLSPQARSLLRWLTKRAVPSIVSKKLDRGSCSPFRDLHLSRISAIGVRESVSPSPLSPLGVPPPRRRSNMNTTPSKVDSSFMEMENRGGKQYVLNGKTKGSSNAHVMVVSLLKSAMTVFTEWLALGGKGVNEIIQSVNEWKQIFQCDVGGIDARSELFPYYCRFGAIVAKQFSRYDVLVDVIISASDFGISDGAEECMKMAITYLLSTKSTKDTKTVELVNALCDMLQENNDKTNEMASVHQFLDQQSSGMSFALKMIMSNERGLVSFADTLSRRLAAKGEKSAGSMDEKLLILLCKEYTQGNTSMKEQLKESILRHLTAESDEFKSVKA